MSSGRELFRHLNYPLYVPEHHRSVLAKLTEGGVPGMMAELQRLSSLGSPWAASTLGYLSLLPSQSGARDPQRAIDLCTKPAAEGDAYALFVLAWALFALTGSGVKAAEKMLAASKMKFAPAILALSAFVWRADCERALKLVDRAGQLGHKAAWVVRCGYYRTGRVGMLRCVLGYALTPLARLRYRLAVLAHPLSENVLVITLNDPRPAYRSNH
jgi:TPR repeat protein